MILSKEGIREALRTGHLTIDPIPDEDQYTSSAVDLVLGDEFKMWDRRALTTPGFTPVLDLSKQEFQRTAANFLKTAEKERDGSILLPPYFRDGSHLLAVTRERVCLNREGGLVARVEGRSSFARLGMVVHLTAPIIHAGWIGVITLEIINFGPFELKLVPNATRICQLVIERLEAPSREPPATEFQGQTTPSGRR